LCDVSYFRDSLVHGKKRDELWVREVTEATGWDVDDIIEEFRSLDADPSERVEHYRSIFENYYREALAHREEGIQGKLRR